MIKVYLRRRLSISCADNLKNHGKLSIKERFLKIFLLFFFPPQAGSKPEVSESRWSCTGAAVFVVPESSSLTCEIIHLADSAAQGTDSAFSHQIALSGFSPGRESHQDQP